MATKTRTIDELVDTALRTVTRWREKRRGTPIPGRRADVCPLPVRCPRRGAAAIVTRRGDKLPGPNLAAKSQIFACQLTVGRTMGPSARGLRPVHAENGRSKGRTIHAEARAEHCLPRRLRESDRLRHRPDPRRGR